MNCWQREHATIDWNASAIASQRNVANSLLSLVRPTATNCRCHASSTLFSGHSDELLHIKDQDYSGETGSGAAGEEPAEQGLSPPRGRWLPISNRGSVERSLCFQSGVCSTMLVG